MSLDRLLEKRRGAILYDWFQRIADGYPSGMGALLRKGKDPFGNPVGSTIAGSTEALYDALQQDAGPDAFRIALDDVIRLRAVQTLTPAEATGFVFELKQAVRAVLGRKVTDGPDAAELVAFEDRIDRAALAAFDLYMDCRERLMRIRLKGAQQGVAQARIPAPEGAGVETHE